MKKYLQKALRFTNKSAFKKNLPPKVSLYFHDIYKEEVNALRDILLFFQSQNYTFVSINEFNSKIESKEKMVALTFDDGFNAWLELIPLFNEFDAKATFFLNSIFLTDSDLTRYLRNINIKSKDRLINQGGIESLVKNGHEIGAHTHSHFTSSKLTTKEFIIEDETNRLYLEKFSEIKNFAIPYGMRRYLTSSQQSYLENKYSSISFGEPGMQFNQRINLIQRHPWLINKSFYFNLENICTNTSYFNKLTLRSGLG